MVAVFSLFGAQYLSHEMEYIPYEEKTHLLLVRQESCKASSV